MKKLFSALLIVPAIAFAQSYPAPTFNSIVLQNPLTPANGGTGATTSTGTGSAVLSNSPSLTTPNLGTPSSVTLTNGTGLPVSTGVSGLGTGVAAALGNAVTGSGSPVLATSPSIASPTITGAFTATGLVTLADHATQAANTVIANATGSTASPTAFAMPSCSGANNALRWTSASGFTCASSIALTSSGLNQFASTTSAQLAGIVSDETGSGSLVFGTSPTITGATISGGTGSFTTLAASSTVSGTGFSNYLASPPAIGGTTPAALSSTNHNIAYTTTYAPGARAPLFIWQNPNGSTAAGYNAGQQIWIGTNPTGTPAAGDTVASTMAVTNGNNRANLWAQNLLVGLCGTAEGCSTSDYVNSPVTGQEIDVYGSASWTPANYAFNPTLGTYPINGQEVYCQGPQYCTAAYSAWSTATNGSNWWQEGFALNRIANIGIHATLTAGDTGVGFQGALIQDDSNSSSVIKVGSGTHTYYFSAPNFTVLSGGAGRFGSYGDGLSLGNSVTIGAASGSAGFETNTGGTIGMYCISTAGSFGECYTHGSIPFYLGSNDSTQLTLTSAGASVTGSLSASGNDALLYSNTNGQTIATATLVTITNWTKTFDRVNANFNASTGTFTAPATGYYQVSGQLVYAAAVGVVNAQYSAAVVANGVAVINGQTFQESTGTEAVTVPFNGVVSLSSGQTIVIQAYQTTGANRTLGTIANTNTLSITRIP
jgi:hypothetical protein